MVSTRDYFFVRHEIPYLTLVIQYFPTRQELDLKLAPQGKREESWRVELSEIDMGLFNLLRVWRTHRSRKEGVPPYILLDGFFEVADESDRSVSEKS